MSGDPAVTRRGSQQPEPSDQMGEYGTNQNNVGRLGGYAAVILAARTIGSDGGARDEPE
jgi:hypothetical protein